MTTPIVEDQYSTFDVTHKASGSIVVRTRYVSKPPHESVFFTVANSPAGAVSPGSNEVEYKTMPGARGDQDGRLSIYTRYCTVVETIKVAWDYVWIDGLGFWLDWWPGLATGLLCGIGLVFSVVVDCRFTTCYAQSWDTCS